MAKERRRESGLIAAWHAATIIARIPFGGEVLDPTDLNPFKERAVPTAALRRLKDWQEKRRWRAAFTPPRKRKE